MDDGVVVCECHRSCPSVGFGFGPALPLGRGHGQTLGKGCVCAKIGLSQNRFIRANFGRTGNGQQTAAAHRGSDRRGARDGGLDVLSAAGNIWQALVGTEQPQPLIRTRIVSPSTKPFRCGNDIPVSPHVSIASNPKADIVILPELWVGRDEDIKGRYPKLMDWVRRRYQRGSTIYPACSGAIMLAETGLLKGKTATSHWAYEDLFRQSYPDVDFRPEPTLNFADASGRIVTAGGTTSWHDLAIHIISRHCSPGEALRVAKVYLLKWHSEGQLPYASLVRAAPHADSIVRACSNWLNKHFREPNAVTAVEKV